MANISKVELNGTTYNINTSGSIPESEKGAANGVASLDSSGKVPSSQLPSYVDDILEYSAKSSFPTTGETGKIYVDTTTNKTYRWSGSAYVEISASLALGETSSTAYRGDRGKAAYNHSQITNGNPHGTTGANTNLTGYSKGSSKDAVAATDTVNAAIAKHENRINANQSNILYTLGKTGRNLFPIDMDEVRKRNTSGTWSGNTYTVNGVTLTFNADCTISTTGTATTRTTIVLATYIPANNRFRALNGLVLSGCPTGGAWNRYALKLVMTDSPYSVAAQDTGTGATIDTTAIPTTANLVALYLDIYANYPTSSSTFKPMFCTQEDWSVARDYTPYRGAPNYDLTRLEAEDRASLAEVVDSGAKNLWDFANAVFDKDSAATHTKTDSDITVTSSGTWGMSSWKITLPAGSYVFRCKIANLSVASGTEARIRVSDGSTAASSTWANTSIITANGIVTDAFTTTGGTVYIQYYATYGTGSSRTNTFKASENMVCTKAAFGVSQKFVPYRPNYDNVIQKITPKDGTIFASYDTTITISNYYLTTLNGMAYFSLTAYTSAPIAAGVDRTVGYVATLSAKSYNGPVIFTASVDRHSEIRCTAWMDAGNYEQNIWFRSEAQIPAGTNFYITGFYPCLLL